MYNWKICGGDGSLQSLAPLEIGENLDSTKPGQCSQYYLRKAERPIFTTLGWYCILFLLPFGGCSPFPVITSVCHMGVFCSNSRQKKSCGQIIPLLRSEKLKDWVDLLESIFILSALSIVNCGIKIRQTVEFWTHFFSV